MPENIKALGDCSMEKVLSHFHNEKTVLPQSLNGLSNSQRLLDCKHK